MKSNYLTFALFCCLALFGATCVNAQHKNLRLVFIRHAEKQDDGDNLNCQGLNRSMSLPAVLYRKFGKPGNIYVPALDLGASTKHARMMQTILPFVSKYDLNINSAYDVKDARGVGKALLQESGTVIIVWEHKNLENIVNYIGIKSKLNWPGNDFDSIWIVTFPNGKPMLTRDTEGLHPAAGCPF